MEPAVGGARSNNGKCGMQSAERGISDTLSTAENIAGELRAAIVQCAEYLVLSTQYRLPSTENRLRMLSSSLELLMYAHGGFNHVHCPPHRCAEPPAADGTDGSTAAV